MASTWAKKYGPHPTWKGRSGFTPTKPKPILPCNQNQPDPRTVNDEKREKYQQDNLASFTTQELIDLDAISSRKLKPSNLDGAIISFLQRDHWYNGQSIGNYNFRTYPLGGAQRAGSERWVGNNDTIWRIMQPSLLIATRMYETARVKTYVSQCVVVKHHANLR